MPDTATAPMTGQSNPPDGGEVTSTAPPPQENGGAMQSWLNTAKAPPAAMPQTASAATPDTVSQQPQALQTVPVPVTSLKRGGILGVMDSMADVLAGKQKPELGKDPDGNLYIKQHSMTRGEQWMKIAGEAMTGAAAGYAAGKGAGNMGKAPLAGMQMQQQQADRQAAQMNEAVLNSANHQMQQMKMAEMAWQGTRLKAKATQEDQDWADKQTAQMEASHAVFLGTTTHPGDIAHLQEAHPGLMKSLVGYKGAEQDLHFVPRYEDGKAAGFDVYKKRPGYGATMLPDGAVFHTFDPATGESKEQKVSGPISQGEIDTYEMDYYNKKKEYENNQIEQDLKKQQAGEAKAKASESPSVIEKNKAETAKARADASEAPSIIGKNWAEAHAAEAKATDDALSSGAGPAGQALVDMIGKGQAPIGRLAYLLARKPELFAAVAAKYPGFDGGKIESYVKAYQEFTSGDVSRDLVSGGTALQHMAELRALNTDESHEPWTPAYTAYMTKANQVAVELAAFYGHSTIPGIKSYMDSFASQLPGKRDKAITTQAESMGDRLDNYAQKWKNAAPSDAYEARMPGISQEAKTAWQSLDPKYDKRTAAPILAAQTAPPAPAPAAGWAPPPGAPAAPQIDNKYLYDPQGKPVAKSLGGRWIQP